MLHYHNICFSQKSGPPGTNSGSQQWLETGELEDFILQCSDLALSLYETTLHAINRNMDTLDKYNRFILTQSTKQTKLKTTLLNGKDKMTGNIKIWKQLSGIRLKGGMVYPIIYYYDKLYTTMVVWQINLLISFILLHTALKTRPKDTNK